MVADALPKLAATGSISSGVVVLGPLFLLVTGGLAIYNGVVQISEAASDAWEYVSGGLKVLAGGIAIVVGAVALVVGAAFLSVPIVIGALAVAAVAGTAAFLIDNRDLIGNILGFDDTEAESSGNKLADAQGP